jgi:hypothetical protein
MTRTINEDLDVATWWFTNTYLGCNGDFVYFDFGTQKIIFSLYIFAMETNQMFIVCNNCVGTIPSFHQLKYDSILKFLWIFF